MIDTHFKYKQKQVLSKTVLKVKIPIPPPFILLDLAQA